MPSVRDLSSLRVVFLFLMDINIVELSMKHTEFKHTFCKRLPEGKVYASIYKAVFPKHSILTTDCSTALSHSNVKLLRSSNELRTGSSHGNYLIERFGA